MNDDDFEALLPWRVTGKLDPSETARLDAALRTDARLRALLALAEEDREATVEVNESLGAPSPAAWDRIAAVVAAEPRPRPLRARLADFVGLGVEPKRGRLAWTGAAAALVIALQAGALVAPAPKDVVKRNAPAYGTASASAAAVAGAQFVIAFAPDARLDDLSKFLSQRHATIVEGPRSGMYKVRFGDKRLGKAETDALLEALRGEPLVKMALPAGS